MAQDTLQEQAAAAPPPHAPTWFEALKLGLPVQPPLTVFQKLKAELQPTVAEGLQGGVMNALRGVAEIPIQATLDTSAILGKTIGEAITGQPAQDEPIGRLAAATRSGLRSVTPVPETVQNHPSFLNTTLPSAIGSTVGFAATGGAGGAAGIALTGALSQGAQAYQEAKDRGQEDGTALMAWALSLLVGASEAIPLGHLAERINTASGGGFARIVREMAIQAGEETAQEVGQQALSNLIAKHTGAPERKIIDGLADSAGAAAVVGALFGAGGAAISSSRSVDSSTEQQQPSRGQEQGSAPVEPAFQAREPQAQTARVAETAARPQTLFEALKAHASELEAQGLPQPGPDPMEQLRQEARAREELEQRRLKREQPWRMTVEELQSAYDQRREADKTAVTRMFGDEGAKRYRQAERMENSADAARSAEGSRIREEMEAALSEPQRDELFGRGDIPLTHDELRPYLDAKRDVQNAETPEQLAATLERAVIDIGRGNAELPIEQWTDEKARVAAAKLDEARHVAEDRGWDLKEISDATLQGAARRFSDPEDAAFVLRHFLREPEAPRAPADQLREVPKLDLVPGEPSGGAGELPAPDKVAEIRSRRAALIEELGRKSKGTARATGLDPETLSTVGKIAATYVEEGVAHFETFARETVEALGEHVRPYLEQAWAAATGERRAQNKRGANPEVGRTVGAKRTGRTVEGVPPSEPPQAATEPAPESEGFDVPKPNRFYELVVDELSRVGQLEKAAPKAVAGGESVQQALDLNPGRRFGEGEKLDRQFVRPLKRALKSSGIPAIESTPEAVSASDFLYALHAPQANQVSAARGGKGSGMSTEEAAAITAKALSGPQASSYRAIQEWNRKLVTRRLDILESGFLISPETRAQWEKEFGPDFVPLRTAADPLEQLFGSPRGFGVTGPESQKRVGRSTKADSPLVFALSRTQEAIERKERNRIGNLLADLATKNPGGPWRVESNANKIRDDEHRLSFKENGERRWIVTSDKSLADAFARIESPDPGVIKLVDPLLGWWHKVIIAWNPIFPLTNIPRDMGTAAIKHAIEGENGAAISVLKQGLPAAWGAFRAIRTEGANGKWSKVYREARDAGALIGWSENLSFKERAAEFENATGVRAKAKAFGDFIDDLNRGTELGSRLVTFDALRRSGKTTSEAAVAARKITADFARRGRLAPIYRRLWLFSGANVQGLDEAFQSVARNKRRAAVVLGSMVAAGFMNALLSYMWGDEEELAKFTDEDKARFFGVMVGKRRYGVAAPYTFNVFPFIGWKLAEVMLRDGDEGEALAAIMASTLDGFSPFPRGANLLQAVTPTVARPAVEIDQNRNYADAPIMPEVNPFDPSPPPDVDRFFRGASGASKAVTRGLYNASGERVDISPETLDHLAKSATGGLGTFLGRSTEVVRKVITGQTDDLRVSDIPFVRPFVQEAYPGADSRLYYNLRAEIDEANDREKRGASLSAEQKRLLEFRKGKLGETTLLSTDSALKRLRAERKAATEERAHAIDGEIEALQRTFVRMVRAPKEPKKK